MDLQLSERITVVTGASKGIGLATARTLLEEGAHVVAVSRDTTPALDALAGANLVHVPADLMDPEGPAHAISRAADAFGGLDILVNNAGGPPPGVKLPRFSFLAPSDADWAAMFEFNLFSAVRAVRAAIPLMLERGGGAIVNVSSGHARQPATMNVDYGAAKAGINHLTKALSEEFAPQGIRVNTVSPGPVRTAWWTDEGGAADILAGALGADRDSVMDTVA
ncbi:MAG: SDR family NAD(P)-dependent oxidoreductase, partial [Pseudonocardiaceae bacterium]